MAATALQVRGGDIAERERDRHRREREDDAVPDRVLTPGASSTSRQLSSVHVLGSMSPVQNFDSGDDHEREPIGRRMERKP